MRHGRKAAFAAASLAVTAAALASETITYTYDARGRLVKVERSGSVNNGVRAEYTYDKGDNRTNVNVVSPN
jgi:YD repeat-containing protein